MAEIQKTTNLGAMTQRFIEFVMMQSQHAALFLGQIENPQTGEATVNLDAAKMFIDQLEMVREKTRNNLTSEESRIIDNSLANLQMAFMEISGDVSAYQIAEPSAEARKAPVDAPKPVEAPSALTAGSNLSSDNKKRFSKNYGS